MPSRLIVNNELVLFGTVGVPAMFDDDDGFTAREVVNALSEMTGDIVVKINSGGGVAFDGITIFNALKDYAGNVTAFIQGVAASAASIIAMAADDVVMQSGSLMMIHNASGLTLGTKEIHLQTAELLEKLDGQIASVYAERGNKSAAEFADLMTAETWMTGDEAIDAGLADRTAEAAAVEPAAFLYELYSKAPGELKARHGDRLAASVHHVSSAIGRELAAMSAAKQNHDEEIITMTVNKQGTADSSTPAPEITLETLQADHADLLESVRLEAAQMERERLEGIDEVAFPGQEELAAKLKADGKTTPAEAAVLFNKAEKALGNSHLANVKAAEAEADVGAAPTASGDHADPVKSLPEGEERWKAEYANDEKVRAEFHSERTYLAYKKAEAQGRVKIHGRAA